ncbi:MAG: hypothetical protein M1829_004465 [Trizodia sp. TS-e1964]|nr:MAG: hypothetical protein M1829_004465 [Trizodia sp. TS-e1964]
MSTTTSSSYEPSVSATGIPRKKHGKRHLINGSALFTSFPSFKSTAASLSFEPSVTATGIPGMNPKKGSTNLTKNGAHVARAEYNTSLGASIPSMPSLTSINYGPNPLPTGIHGKKHGKGRKTNGKGNGHHPDAGNNNSTDTATPVASGTTYLPTTTDLGGSEPTGATGTDGGEPTSYGTDGGETTSTTGAQQGEPTSSAGESVAYPASSATQLPTFTSTVNTSESTAVGGSTTSMPTAAIAPSST